MSTIVTRAGKGSPLTSTEVDSNFTNLNTDKVEKSGSTMTGDLAFGDNVKVKFGASDDLQIYHDGSASWIDDAGTGNLNIRGGGGIFLRSPANEAMIEAVGNGKVGLYYDASQKLATTSSGVDITGTVVADGLTVGTAQTVGFVSADVNISGGNAADSYINLTRTSSDANSGVLNFGKTSAGSVVSNSDFLGAIQFCGDDGTDINTAGARIRSQVTGTVASNTIPASITIQTAETSSGPLDRLKVANTGDISFYEDTGTTAKLTWDASAEELQFKDNVKAEFGDGGDLQIYHNGTNSYIADASGTGFINIRSNAVRLASADGSEILADFVQNGAVTLYYNNSAKLATTSTGIDVTGTVTADGFLGGTNVLRINSLEGSRGSIQISAPHLLTREVTYGNNFYLASDGTYTQDSAVIGGGLLQMTAPNADFGEFLFKSKQDPDSGGAVRDRLKIANTGDISFYNDAGTSQDFYWNASTSRLGLGTTSPGADIHVSKAVPNIRWADSGASGVNQIYQSGSAFVLDCDPTNADANSRIAFKVDNSERMRIDSSGRVGIGITSPATVFEVKSAGNTAETVAQFGNLNIEGGLQIKTNGNLEWGFNALNSRSLTFSTNQTERMRIDSSGNVGIGTTSPSTVLHVENGATSYTWTPNGRTAAIIEGNNFSGTTLSIIGKSTGYSGLFFGDEASEVDGQINYDHTTGAMRFATRGAEKARIDSSGNVGIGISNPSAQLHLSQAGGTLMKLGTSQNTCEIEARESGAANILVFSSNNSVDHMAITDGGKVGIGTTSPSSKLQIQAGDLNVGGNDSSNPFSKIRLGASQYGACDIVPTDESNHKIGMAFYVDGTQDTTINPTEAMRIDSSGRLGIGTTSPEAPLEIAYSTSAPSLEESDAGLLLSANNTLRTLFGADPSSPYAHWIQVTNSSGSQAFPLALNPQGGNVGIGATALTSYNTQADDLVIKNASHGGITIHSGTTDTGNIFFADGTTGNEAYRGWVQYNHSQDYLAFGTAGTEVARIASSGRLGIGTTSPASPLQVDRASTDGDIVTLSKDGTTVGSIGVDNTDNLFISGNSTHAGFMFGTANVVPYANGVGTDGSMDLGWSQGQFQNIYLSEGVRADTLKFNSRLGTEYGRFDTSGNLLVGTTSTLAGPGVELRSDGQIVAIRSNNRVAWLNRTGSDGSIVDFVKDGTTVGSIGTVFSDLCIGTGDTGIRFWDAGPGIFPVDPSNTFANKDNAVDLGLSSVRWKDLYLSGGVSNPAVGGTLTFDTAGSESMRIDSSASLLVGGTTSGASNAHTFYSYGLAQHRRSSGHAVILDRLADDGAIATFRKDGTTVGSIGSRSGVVSQIVLDPRSGSFQGAGIAGSGEAITPMDHSQQADAHTSLGNSSYRWKDLYLSGGVYLGGTGSANLLDDYEEGTWTPTYEPETGSFTTMDVQVVDADYVKIGSRVWVTCWIRTNDVDTTGASGLLYVSGLPFSASGYFSVNIGHASNFSGEHPLEGILNTGDSRFLLRYRSTVTSGSSNSSVSDLSNGTNANHNQIRLHILYTTAS